MSSVLSRAVVVAVLFSRISSRAHVCMLQGMGRRDRGFWSWPWGIARMCSARSERFGQRCESALQWCSRMASPRTVV